MDKVVNKTVDVLTRFGDTLGRRFATEDNDDLYFERSGSSFMFPSAGSAFRRPLDKKYHKNKIYSFKQRDLNYVGARNYSSDNLSASPSYSSFNNYRQNPVPREYAGGVDRPIYGTGIGAPLNYGFSPNYGYGSNYNTYSGAYSDPSSNMPYGSIPGSVGYAPDYYIAERRQVELVPAPPPRVIQREVPVPYPVDRPVPQPYPVEVPRPYPVDRPVPVPVPSPVPFDRPVAVPVPVPVPSPPVCVPVPVAVPTPVACYIPVGVPVPSPPPSPIMFEQSVTHSQRWLTGSPVMMNQQNYLAGSPVMGMNPYMSYGNGSFIR